MTPERARAILEEVARGTVTAAAALEQFAAEPVEALDFATVDHHRALR
ncbi:MAG: 1-(5-phosphoribosyl)-5-amino-4-imidazole-carboxylate carboxylase, partial [Cytophagaceae bacterium]|nr:1-(5-phosphoribosyl)-5-amino-4-imidazole-carboxylate carboxylase [Gemmatimonadaceae bacterium]